jgi:hypothetical protein
MKVKNKKLIEIYDDQAIATVNDGLNNEMKIIGDLFYEVREFAYRYMAYLHVTMEYGPCFWSNYVGIGKNIYLCQHGISYVFEVDGVMGCD